MKQGDRTWPALGGRNRRDEEHARQEGVPEPDVDEEQEDDPHVQVRKSFPLQSDEEEEERLRPKKPLGVEEAERIHEEEQDGRRVPQLGVVLALEGDPSREE